MQLGGAGFTFFFGERSPFSQWHPAPFMVGGVRFPTAEHYMMYAKAVLFGDRDAARAVLRAPGPKEAKAIGRRVAGFSEPVWDEHKMRIVGEASLAKFEQNEIAREALLATRGTILVEASPFDRIWGIGLGEMEARKTDPASWPGQNLLGITLSVVRESLACRAEYEARLGRRDRPHTHTRRART